jgi:hypothetical protein
MTIVSKIPIADAERLVRARLAHADQVWVWADAASFRRLRRLHARLRCDPVLSPDVALFEPPRRMRAEYAGGLLVVGDIAEREPERADPEQWRRPNPELRLQEVQAAAESLGGEVEVTRSSPG